MQTHEALEIVVPVLEQYFQDNNLEQTLVLWEAFARHTPERVGSVLAAFAVLANDATLDLRPILLEHGWINLFHTEDGVPVIATPEEHRQWLLELITQLRQSAAEAQ